MKSITFVILVLGSIACLAMAQDSQSFECYVCNKDPHEDDALPCVERVEACSPNVTSCSSVAFRSSDGGLRTRKFCTSPGIPIYQYLMLFPGSSLCQNIETTLTPEPPPEPVVLPGNDGKPVFAFPPAPPSHETSTMLCVCTKPLCNGGTYREVMERTMLRNLVVAGIGNEEHRLKKVDLFFNKLANPPPAIKFI